MISNILFYKVLSFTIIIFTSMVKDTYKVIGVMSGTSLDGIDLVYVEFNKTAHWDFTVLKAETIGYDAIWRENLTTLTSVSLEDLKHIDTDYTHYLAGVINGFIQANHINDLDAICSHGHTALHQPQNKLTYQIGNKPLLATLTEMTVVCDFRVQDVELGGQGAPLVPIGDELLFYQYVFCLNLGGFANISSKINGEIIAYDICPLNIVLNRYVKPLGLHYDDRGIIASTGVINEVLLRVLNDLDFYKLPYPKSLGLEWVRACVFPLIDLQAMETQDILRTFVEHIAIQISVEINKIDNASVLISGGGVYNEFLINRIKSLTNNKIIVPSKEIIEFKEAIIFGFLGVLRL